MIHDKGPLNVAYDPVAIDYAGWSTLLPDLRLLSTPTRAADKLHAKEAPIQAGVLSVGMWSVQGAFSAAAKVW